MSLGEIAPSLLVGLAGGGLSGLLGVSSGGVLVLLGAFVLGLDQHAAQGVSLAAQVLPTNIAGVRNYARRGHGAPLRWIAWLAAGFVAGGCLGALLAAGVADRALAWTYAGYLAALWLVVALRPSQAPARSGAQERLRLPAPALVGVGALGGLASGFLGIGGGLAISVGLVAALKAPQHQAQAASLAATALPLTLPAALVYMRQGWSPPWLTILGVVIGLWIGADVGSRLATRISGAGLRRAYLTLVAVMAALMAFKAAR